MSTPVSPSPKISDFPKIEPTKKTLTKEDFIFEKLEKELNLGSEKKRKPLQQRIIKQLEAAKQQKEEQDLKPRKFRVSQKDDIKSEIEHSLDDFEKYDIERSIIHKKSMDFNNLQIGLAYCQNLRKGMEDEWLVERLSIEIGKIVYNMNICGVFDGHGGKECSTFVKKNFSRYFTHAIEANNPRKLNDQGIWDALKATFLKLHLDYSGTGGTTVSVAVTIEDKIWFANAGDSRGALSNFKEEAIQMTADNKPDNAKDRKKIEKLGGKIKNGRVCNKDGKPSLNIARGIGDKNLVGVIPDPKITYYPLNEVDLVLIASDGFWGVVSTQSAINAVKEMLNEERTVGHISQNLVYSSIKKCQATELDYKSPGIKLNSTDNVTVLTLLINPDKDVSE